jgi:hypothetical protein
MGDVGTTQGVIVLSDRQMWVMSVALNSELNARNY